MKQFSIAQVLIFNPTLKSDKKKPIQSDIQQAKIVAYFPHQALIQQKCNTVGMAQGVYEFGRCLLSEEQRQKSPKKLFVIFDSCCLISKEVEENTWVFLKIAYDANDANYVKYNEDEENTYIDSIITQDIALNILNHFYQSFKIFYGYINAFIFLKKLPDLQSILTKFVPAYEDNNRMEELKRLDISSYIMNSIRALPLDVNTTLKFNYFKNVLESFDPNIQQIMIFSSGFLAYSSLDKDTTWFFSNYFYGIGEPFRFQYGAFNRKLKQIGDLSGYTHDNRYGTFFNSLSFGIGSVENNLTESKLSVKKTVSQSTVPIQQSQSQSQSNSFDLLGLSEGESLAFPEVYIQKNGEEQKYQVTFFLEKKMLFVTFYKVIASKEKVIFQNRFYYENIPRFNQKISETLNGILSPIDNYRFLYTNLNTYTGKSSIEKWAIFTPEMRYVWQNIENNKQAQIASTIQNHWVYGIHRLNRVLVLMIPSQVPLHKLDDFAQKMLKGYLFKAYM